MAIIPIRIIPDPVLRQKAKRLRLIDRSVERLAQDMIATMHSAHGVGLAAPQIGVPLRLVVIGVPEQKEIVLINPEIVRKSGERLVQEGCLSVPGYVGQIKRAQSVKVKGRDLSGKEIRIGATDLLAQALEHEIDHLNGVLYLDHLESPENLSKIEPEETRSSEKATPEA